MLLRSNARRWAAGGFAAAVLLAGAGLTRLAGDDKPATKDDKPAIDPKDVRVGPPPELAELRKAVEEAAKKGENVDEIRKHLEALEKALAGKAWVKPKPAEEPPAPAFPPAPPVGGVGGNVGRVPQGRLPQPGPFDPGARVRAELMKRAAELMAQDPQNNRAEAEKLIREAQELMLQEAGRLDPAAAARIAARGDARGAALAGAKLGVRIEKVPAVLADQLELPAGRGLVVAEVRPGSPADKAGIKVNDVILEFARQPVTENAGEFIRMVEIALKADVTVMRKGKKQEIKGVQLPDEPAPQRVPQPELPPQPVPPVAVRGVPAPPVVVGGLIARVAPVEGNSVSLRVNNGTFTLTADQDGVKYTIEGTLGGKATPSKFQITDGDKKIEADSLDKVPAEYRKQVEKLLGTIQIGER
jgi:hypothetical protein